MVDAAASDTVVVVLEDSVSFDNNASVVAGVVVVMFVVFVSSVVVLPLPNKCVSGGVHPSAAHPDECPDNVGLLSVLPTTAVIPSLSAVVVVVGE